MTPFTFIDLFAGIGGFRLAFEAVGGECVFSSEKDRFARETYRANHDCGGHPFPADIRAVDAAEVPRHDVLLAGFPCQPFSFGGVSKRESLGLKHGFQDRAQGTLFFEIARILEECQPPAFLLENVPHLRGHDKGRTFAVILRVLEELGYRVHYRVLSAVRWAPQRRRRLFLAGFREEHGFTFDDVVLPSESPVLGAILEDVVDDRYTLSDRLWATLQAHKARHRAKGNGFGYGFGDPAGTTRPLNGRYGRDGSEILVEQPGRNPRRLTPRECCRLMGFPADFRIPVSDSQAYRQFGNAVVPPLVEAIAEVMMRPAARVLPFGDPEI